MTLNFFVLTAILLVLLAMENAYYSFAGSWVMFFSPQPMLLAAAFIGILFGPGPAVWWAASAGLLEEFCFMDSKSVLGITPLVYCWIAYTAGKFFHGRADATNPTIGLVVSLAALIVGYAGGSLLSASFGVPANLLAAPWTWGRIISWVLQIFLAGPVLLMVLAKTAGKNHTELRTRMR